MKPRLKALVSTLCIAFCAPARAAESYGNGQDACLEIDGKRFGIRLIARGNAHEILGSGMTSGDRDELALVYTDSFGNDIAAAFSKTSGLLRTRIVSKGLHAPSGVLATYGTYQLHPSTCTSSALP